MMLSEEKRASKRIWLRSFITSVTSTAMLCQQGVAIICNNIYLIMMGYRPYSIKLVSQALWIVGLIAFYIVVNMGVFSMVMWQKIVVYLVIVALLLLYWKIVKKHFSANANIPKKQA